jgi:hypothetical protein
MLIGFTPPEPDDEYDVKLLSDIAKYGWHVVAILAEGDFPEFCFSVGLYSGFGHPEILVMGLAPAVGGRLINNIGNQIRAGANFQPGEVYTELLSNFSATFTPIASEHYRDHLGYALWYYRSLLPKSFPALQLIWPDRSGQFPWEAGYDRRFFSLQRVLSRAS